MGKRKKSARKPKGPKKQEPLPTSFSCLFCNHEKSVAIKLDKKLGVGQLSCKVCGQRYQSPINYLSAPVDVYSDWIDACESVAKGPGGPGNTGGRAVDRIQGSDGEHGDDYDDGGGFVNDEQIDEDLPEEDYDVAV